MVSGFSSLRMSLFVILIQLSELDKSPDKNYPSLISLKALIVYFPNGLSCKVFITFSIFPWDLSVLALIFLVFFPSIETISPSLV